MKVTVKKIPKGKQSYKHCLKEEIPFWEKDNFECNDKEYFKAFKNTYGFSPTEVWSLDYTIARFVLPRLIYFRDNLNGCPSSFIEDPLNSESCNAGHEKWEEALNKMIKAFYLLANYDWFDYRQKDRETIKEGLELFAKHFTNLWD
jgi:hypothetical protein